MPKDINCMSGRCRFSSKILNDVKSFCVETKSVIELGCGCGKNLQALTFVSVKVGIDPFEPNIIAARSIVPEAKLYIDSHFKLKDFSRNEFDLGITCSVLDHIESFEVALDDLLRICKKLLLIEPMIEGENRQALISETTCPSDTWYFDYRKALLDRKVKFIIEKTPLYKKNSGPLYHTIFANCEDK